MHLEDSMCIMHELLKLWAIHSPGKSPPFFHLTTGLKMEKTTDLSIYKFIVNEWFDHGTLEVHTGVRLVLPFSDTILGQ